MHKILGMDTPAEPGIDTSDYLIKDLFISESEPEHSDASVDASTGGEDDSSPPEAPGLYIHPGVSTKSFGNREYYLYRPFLTLGKNGPDY